MNSFLRQLLCPTLSNFFSIMFTSFMNLLTNSQARSVHVPSNPKFDNPKHRVIYILIIPKASWANTGLLPDN